MKKQSVDYTEKSGGNPEALEALLTIAPVQPAGSMPANLFASPLYFLLW